MKRTEWMFKIAVNRDHMINGQRLKKWIIKDIKSLNKNEEVRCMHCDGEIRLHQGAIVRWHGEHMHLEDAVKCPGSPEEKEYSSLQLPDEEK